MNLNLLLILCVITLFSGCSQTVKRVYVDRNVTVKVPVACDVKVVDCGVVASDSDVMVASKYYTCVINLKSSIKDCQ